MQKQSTGVLDTTYRLHLMKIPMFPVAAVVAGGMAVLVTPAQAQLFSYADQNALLAIRPASGSTATDTLIFNLGPVSAFYNATPASTITVGDATALNTAFSSLANLRFSVSAANRTVTTDVDHPLQTIWVTRPRSDVSTQSTPWNRQSSGGLSNTGSKIASLGSGAVTLSGYQGRTNQVLIPLSDTAHHVGKWVGSGGSGAGTGPTGNFQSTFQGNAENTTPAGFGPTGFVRSDFYQITPGTDQSTYLGFFQFNGNGSTTFTAVPEPEEYAALAGAALVGFALWRRSRPQA
jgi:hypothetical protein